MPDDEFYAMEDDFIILPDYAKEQAKLIQSKYRNVLAIVLIVIGTTILWNNLYDIVEDVLPDFARNVLNNFGHLIPQLFIATAIIALGIYLIRGKKKDLDELEKEKFLDDKGGL